MDISRYVFYKLPPGLRYLVRIVAYLPKDVLDFRDRRRNLIPPRGLIFTGSGDYVKDGNRWLEIFRRYGLKPTHSFLDIGSGIGRIARPLCTFLNPGTTYQGFDIIGFGVRWCRMHISRRYPNFHFTLMSLKNDLYRNSGEDASKITFPYEPESFDFACATSVFTHMLPDETQNYLRQCHRVLRPGGVLVATFFLKDDSIDPLAGAHLVFPYHYEHHALHSNDAKGANVCYDKSFIDRVCRQAGFETVDYQPGYWHGLDKKKCLDFQDCLVLRKPGGAV